MMVLVLVYDEDMLAFYLMSELQAERMVIYHVSLRFGIEWSYYWV